MQKITPFLWFDTQAEEAMQGFTTLFAQGTIEQLTRYPDADQGGPMQAMAGRVMTAIFSLANHRFMALDGGPQFRFTPATSFFVNCETEAEIDALWAGLIDGGTALMPYDKYPFSEKFGWVQDRYGLSWQLNLAHQPQNIAPFLMFSGMQHGKAEEAIAFYTSLFAESGLVHIDRYGEGETGAAGTVRLAQFRLHGQTFMAIDSSLADTPFNEAISLYVTCDTQEEIDQLWAALSAVPAAEQCGWLKDRYGVSWQIVPSVLGTLMTDPDPEKSARVLHAFLQMKKFDIAGLLKAHAGG